MAAPPVGVKVKESAAAAFDLYGRQASPSSASGGCQFQAARLADRNRTSYPGSLPMKKPTRRPPPRQQTGTVAREQFSARHGTCANGYFAQRGVHHVSNSGRIWEPRGASWVDKPSAEKAGNRLWWAKFQFFGVIMINIEGIYVILFT